MKRSFLLALILGCAASAAVTLEEISDKPASRAKNFMIWQYLHQDINASQASDAFYQVDYVNERFLFDYAQKSDEPEIRYTADCMQKISTELLSIEQDDCLYLALTPTKAQMLQSTDRDTIADRLGDRFGNVEWLRTMNRDDHFSIYTDVQASLNLFNIVSPTYREEHFNRMISNEVLESMTAMKGFGTFVYLSITDPKLDLIQQSLTNVSGGIYDFQTHFYLAINALRYHRAENALYHLNQAKEKAYSPMDRDRVNFWIYRASGDEDILKELASSLDINMYTLWAKERLGIETENYYTVLPTTKPGGFKGDDPFKWQQLHQLMLDTPPERLYELVDQYDGDDSVAVQAYMIERVYQPYVHNFTMPYDQYMEGLTTDQKAILYALMRQETRMIPGLISRSFALGLMQIMPFNVDSISKIHAMKVSTYEDMFNPAYNIPYAIEHMKHIDKTLYNPVLKAYAYNGGIGFTKRLLLSKGMFETGEYEPFMSMELVSNAESREYGKKVLANYVIYKKILGEPVSISALFDNLTQPSQSDYFRAEALKMPVQ